MSNGFEYPAVPFIVGAPADATAPPPQGDLGLGPTYFAANKKCRNSIMLFPKQGFVNLKSLGGAPLSLKIGRFEFNEGMEAAGRDPVITALKRTRVQQRLIGTFGWSHVGRSYNGFHYAYDPPGLNVTFVGAIPSRGVFQVDGWAL